MKRWPVISERKPEHLSVSRANAATKQKIDQWFEFLAFHLTDMKIPIEENKEYGIVMKRASAQTQ